MKHLFSTILAFLTTLSSTLRKRKPTTAYAARSFSDDPLQKFNFRISLPGLPAGWGFQKIGGLSREIGVASYYEAGYPHEHKLKGREQGGQLTCERGCYVDRDLEQLYDDALSDRGARKDVTITLLDRDGMARRAWLAHECWVSKWEIDDLDATSDDVIIEKATIEYEWLEQLSV